MLPRSRRLVHDRDFTHVFRRGSRLKGRYILVNFIENKQNISRFGFVTSLKVSKRATERNRLKRHAREYISNNLSNFREGLDISLSFLPSAKGVIPADLRHDFDAVLTKIKKSV